MTDLSEPPFDLVRIIDAFERHGVSYIAIGGVSGMLHGAVHYVTQDVDVMVRAVDDNLAKIIAALNDLGVGTDHEITVAELRRNTQWNTQAGPIDILLTATGPRETEITFTDLTPGAQFFQIARGLAPTRTLRLRPWTRTAHRHAVYSARLRTVIGLPVRLTPTFAATGTFGGGTVVAVAGFGRC